MFQILEYIEKMFKILRLKNYNATISVITNQTSLNSVYSEMQRLRPLDPY